MNITTFSDYTLRVLIYLASHEGERSTAEQIAKAYDISFHHVAKAGQWLAREGYVNSERGRAGGMTLRKCVSDYPAPDSKVLVTVDLARLTLHELDAEGAPAEDGGTEFSWDIVIKYERTERTLRITYATDEDGGTEDIEIVSRDADHFEQCVGRVMLERGWLRHVVSGGGPTDNELALAGPRSPRPNFFRS